MIKAKEFREKRRTRNWALAAFLLVLSLLFYGITIVRF